MEERSTLARPYAVAIFKLAQQDGKFALWSEMLGFLGQVLADPTVQGLIADPRVDSQRVARLVNDVAGGRFTDQAQNLVKVLAQNARLDVIGEIIRQYEQARSAAEKREVVELVSAFEVNPKFQQSIASAMASRLGREVELKTRIDKDLIGGVVIRAGDLVIDASLKGRLAKLATSLV